MGQPIIALTPDESLAHWLMQEKIRNPSSPKAIPFDSWLAKIYQANPYFTKDYITPIEENLIWQFLLDQDPLANYQDDLAALPKLITHWQLSKSSDIFSTQLPDVAEKYSAFQNFIQKENLITTHELPETLILEELNNTLIFKGFHNPTPLLKIFWEKLRTEQINFEISSTPPNKASTSKVRFNHPLEELSTAINWAKAYPGKQVGIVIPNLPEQAPLLKRLIAYEKLTDFSLAWSPELSSTSIAIFLKNLLNPSYSNKFYQTLLLSPLWGDFHQEFNARHQIIEKLTKIPCLEKQSLIDLAPSSIKNQLTQFFKFWENNTRKRSLADWVTSWLTFLDQIGFIQRLKLNNEQREITEQIYSQMFWLRSRSNWFPALSSNLAGNLLDQALRKRLPNPVRSTKINFLDSQEIIGVNFDALWITQASELYWPSPVHPNAVLNYRLQEQFNLPHATPNYQLGLAQQTFDLYTRYAPEIIFSYAADEEFIDFSPLLKKVVEIPSTKLITPSRTYIPEPLEPIAAQFNPKKKLPLTLKILETQSRCPFRAFLEFHLNLKIPLSSAQQAKIERGINLHRFLTWYWQTYPQGKPKSQWAKIIKDFFPQLAPVELHCISYILKQWLELETKRPFFKIIGIEQTNSLNLAGQNLNLRIDRLDQIAEGLCLIDYKSGSTIPSPEDWVKSRIKNLQIPLYYLSQPEITHFAFGCLTWQKVGLRIFSFQELAKKIASSDLEAFWKDKLNNLAKKFYQGECSMDPIDPKNCSTCAFKVACRHL